MTSRSTPPPLLQIQNLYINTLHTFFIARQACRDLDIVEMLVLKQRLSSVRITITSTLCTHWQVTKLELLPVAPIIAAFPIDNSMNDDRSRSHYESTSSWWVKAEESIKEMEMHSKMQP